MRVLHVIGAMNRAGAETFLMNLYREIDRNRVQFDFLVHTDKACDYDEEIQDLGGKIYRLPRYNVLNYHRYRKASESFFRAHPEHPIVHGHIGSSAPVYLREAKHLGRFTIAHSHNTSPNNAAENVLFNIVARPVRKIADYFMACSPEAATDRFGRMIATGSRCSIVRNGIIADRYCRNPSLIAAAKKQYGTLGIPAFGHIGRFTKQKNHPFLIDAFANIHETLPEAQLLLAGCGETEPEIRELAHNYGLARSVRFLGVQEDMPAFLRAIDVFLFPSLWEGLGIALIEAQTAGLQCIVSDRIPCCGILTDRTVQLPPCDSREWAQQGLLAYDASRLHSDDCISAALSHGYNITQTAQLLTDFYETHAR